MPPTADTIPVAKKEITEITGITKQGEDAAQAQFAWKFVPNEVGKAFDTTTSEFKNLPTNLQQLLDGTLPPSNVVFKRKNQTMSFVAVRQGQAMFRRNIVTGVLLDERWHEIIVQGGRLFYERIKNCTMSEAYRKTLRHFCPLRDSKTGKIILPQPEKGEVFTYDQFRYHYKKDADANLQRFIENRLGKRAFNIYKRPRTGTARDGLYGPYTLYQIDATIADVYLVNNSPYAERCD